MPPVTTEPNRAAERQPAEQPDPARPGALARWPLNERDLQSLAEKILAMLKQEARIERERVERKH